jgi:hypothetical protein
MINILQMVENKLYSLLGRVKLSRWNKMVKNHWKSRTTYLAHLLGNNPLSDNQIEEIKRFWSKYIDVDISDHQFYYNARKDFDVRYIPSFVHYTIIDKYFNNWEKAKIVDNKTEYQRLFPNIKQPETILTRCNGFWYSNESILSKTKVIDVILSNTPCFLKLATDSEGGKGVYYIESYSNWDLVKLIDQIKGDIIVQKALVQSSELSVMNSSSINTIRLMTLLNLDGSVKLCSASLRMGIDGARVDNASSGGVVAGINEKGHLKEYAYNLNGERLKIHPTSNIKFENFKIPNFDKCKEAVFKLAPNYPYFRLISWDIALNQDNEPILIEANLCSGGLVSQQLSNGPIFGDDTEKILNEVFMNRNKNR